MRHQSAHRKKPEASWSEALKTIAHTVFWGGFWVLMAVGAYEAWLALRNPNVLPIQEVVLVAGDLHVSRAELERRVSENLQGTLLSLDESKLKKALLQLPWVANVSIRRVWPGKLIIAMSEQVPIARWGHNQLLNKDLEIFSPPPSTFPPELPSLFGPKASEAELWERYQDLSQSFAPLKLRVVSLELSPRNSWSFLLSNDVEVVLGREDLEARLKRLVELYPRLITEHQAQIVLIDLRYPNGLAVKWKDNKSELTH